MATLRHSPFLRHRRLYAQLIRTFLFIFTVYSVLEVLQIQTWHAQSTLLSRPSLPLKPQRIYIASLHWNNEEILRSSWNKALVSLTEVLGPESVFVSVYESGSWDNSKELLRELDQELERLGVERNITLEDKTHLQHISALPANEGWIMTRRKKMEMRRIPYLARLRNYTLKDLERLAGKGRRFDTVLFLGDVAFTVEDVLELLSTNDGEYAAACSLDFNRPPLYYDTFALRDLEGNEHASQTWPYFRSKESRRAMKMHEPVPVKSCWNGIVAMSADPFMSETPLRFRGISDTLATQHLEGSECCLLHADNPLSASKGVFLNPRVRVGYTLAAYNAIHPTSKWLSSLSVFTGLWKNRLKRYTSTPWIQRYKVKKRIQRWKGQEATVHEPGGFCLNDEMQVIIENGWAHV